MQNIDRSNSIDEAESRSTEVIPKARRRRFSASYKLGVLNEADACTAPGEVGALLRREGLYSSHLTQWRRQRARGTLYGSTQAGKELAAKDEEISRLRQELSLTRSRLRKAEAIIDIQGKVGTRFGISSPAEDEPSG